MYLRIPLCIQCMSQSATRTRIPHILADGYFHKIFTRICLHVVRDFNQPSNLSLSLPQLADIAEIDKDKKLLPPICSSLLWVGGGRPPKGSQSAAQPFRVG